MCAVLLAAVASLEIALFRHDFNVAYVAAYTSRNLPTFYTWSALYAGQKGSLLFWATVLTFFGSLAQWLTAPRHRVYLPYVAAVTCLVATFFVSVTLFAANPFERLPTGSSRSANGRSCPGCSSRSGSASACGGPTWSSAGAAIGPGTR